MVQLSQGLGSASLERHFQGRRYGHFGEFKPVSLHYHDRLHFTLDRYVVVKMNNGMTTEILIEDRSHVMEQVDDALNAQFGRYVPVPE